MLEFLERYVHNGGVEDKVGSIAGGKVNITKYNFRIPTPKILTNGFLYLRILKQWLLARSLLGGLNLLSKYTVDEKTNGVSCRNHGFSTTS